MENQNLLSKEWRNNKNFTKCIKGNNDSILSIIAKRLNINVYEGDYYSIDAVFYKSDDLCPNIKPGTFWFRNILIAFEHENNFKSGLYQEMCHLVITNSELKVLVTYPDSEEKGEEELEKFSQIIKGNRKEFEFSANEEILVIYGYESDFSWDGYLYNSEHWIKL